jgi:hypothetical protein
MQRPVETKVDLPHPALRSANWADCYLLRVTAAGLTAGQAARLAVGRFPLWVRVLMRIRNSVGVLFGLKPARAGGAGTIGIFPVVTETPDEIVLGFDDRHLDFRIVIAVEHLDDDDRNIRVTTLVYRKIMLGRIYIAVITPFHKLIVGRMLGDLGARLAAVNPPA